MLAKKADERPIFFIGDAFAPSGIDDYCVLNRNLVHEDDGDSDDKSGNRNTDSSLSNVLIELYPNPVVDLLQIRIGSEIADYNKVLKISIISINGSKTVLSEHEEISGPKELAFNISALEKGIYYLLLEGKNISKATKFIKY